MKILFFIEEAAIGGVRTVTEILSKKFEERGHRIKWLMQYRYYNNDRDFPAGFDCTYLPSRELDSPDNREFLCEFIKDNNIDVM